MADRDRIIKDFLDLSAIDSESFRERDFANVLIEKLKNLGLHPIQDASMETTGSNTGNVFVRWPGEGNDSSVLLSAHMDTVQPGKSKKPVIDEKEGIIKSDGSTVLGADDVAGIVEILEAIRILQESNRKHKTAELLFPVAEEAYTKGSSAFDYSRVLAKEAYCLDLSGHVGRAAVKAPTLISFRIAVHGKASHAGFAPKEGINAIAVTAKAIAGIPQGQVDEESTLNFGILHGGKLTNIVPDEVCAEGEIRSFRHERALELLEKVRSVFEKTAKDAGAVTEIQSEIHLTAYERNENEEVVTRFKKAAERIGIRPETVKTMGGSDNHSFNQNGIKGIVLSCGMQNVHTTEEFIEIADLLSGADLIAELLATDE